MTTTGAVQSTMLLTPLCQPPLMHEPSDGVKVSYAEQHPQHPPAQKLLFGIVPRLYQETILNTCTIQNTLVVLPTGLGKTAIAMLLAAHRITQYPNSKILVVAPTKPLVLQHHRTFMEHFSSDLGPMAIFTGEVAPEKRIRQWKESRFIFATPQSLENDLLSNRVSLSDVSLLVVDEAHRAVGDYAYVYLAKRYHESANAGRILALTASPGATMEHILDVCKNLHIQEVEVRSIKDPDVAPYVQETDFTVIHVNLSDELLEIKKKLDTCFASKLSEARKLSLLGPGTPTKGELLGMQADLRNRITQGERDFEILRTISLLAEALKVSHAQELLESQGLHGLSNYFQNMDLEAARSATKAAKNLSRDINWRTAIIKTNRAIQEGIIHPKIPACVELVKTCVGDKPGEQAIIFTQFRDTARELVSRLAIVPGVSPHLFVGQTKKGDTGISQKEQGRILDRFRAQEFNTLVATCVAEEGLDIPSVNTVVFYEPIPSAIRSIQRRGRTARHEKGNVYVLATKGTRDEIYRWSSHRKEQRMHRILGELKHNLAFRLREHQGEQETLAIPSGPSRAGTSREDAVLIRVDPREKGSPVMKVLVSKGVQLDLAHMEAGDFQVSPRVIIEYKTCEDFVNSIIDKRIFNQAKSMKAHAIRPIIIVEGERDMYAVRNIHPNAINGLLSTLAVTFNIPVIFTRNPEESASTILSIAKRESDTSLKHFSGHQLKKPATPKEQQEYLLASLPGVSGSLAKKLLEHFGTPARVLHATVEELKQVNLIGEKKAQDIFGVLHAEYPRNDSQSF